MKRERRGDRAAGAAVVSHFLVEPMGAPVAAAVRRLARLPGVARVAVMPDVHLAEKVCVGAVIATRGVVYPEAVGGDIGCGIAVVALDGDAVAMTPDRARCVLGAIGEAVPVLRHRSLATAPPLPPELDPRELSGPAAAALREGRIELGTLGRGNHFLEIQTDEEGRLWLMVHSGSRIVGQAVARASLAETERVSGGLHALDARSPAGESYLGNAAWAERFARANRYAMLAATAGVIERELGIRADWSSLVECNHNHVREEEHFGERLLVHRKGASPAAAGEPGLIPGSMGTESFHILGRGEPESLRSSSHGAGRAMPRAHARERITAQRLRRELGGLIFDERLERALREEAPGAYKDIRAVMRAQRKLVRILRRVRTLVSYKGG